MQSTTGNHATRRNERLIDGAEAQDNGVRSSVVGCIHNGPKGNGNMWTIARTDYDAHGAQVGCHVTADVESDTATDALFAAVREYRRDVPKATVQMDTDHVWKVIRFAGRNVSSYSTFRVGGAK
ncbi:hypothetical protein ACFYU5_19245 [Nocardia aobensis]|uniref:Transposase n=1 Tax=Nocardia aobensis TaxID=257277 RepID=A0ABW6P5X7_9NOCA